MAWAIPTVIGTFAGPQTGVTSGSFNTTGYTFLCLSISSYTSTAYTVSDNKSNSWLTSQRQSANAGAGSSERFYYAYNPTVGTGHTFTISGSTVYPSVFVIGSTGGQTASDPKDVDNGANNALTSVQPGSGTPSADNQLLLCSLSSGASANADMTVSGSSFTKLAGYSFNSGGFGELGTAISYVIQTTAGAANPTWSSATSTVGLATVMVSFKVAPAAGGDPVGGVVQLGMGPQAYSAGRRG